MQLHQIRIPGIESVGTCGPYCQRNSGKCSPGQGYRKNAVHHCPYPCRLYLWAMAVQDELQAGKLW